MVEVKPPRRVLDARMCVFLTGEKPLCSSKTCEANGVVDTDTCECKCEGDYYGSSCESKCDLLYSMALLLYQYVTVVAYIMHLYCRMHRTSVYHRHPHVAWYVSAALLPSPNMYSLNQNTCVKMMIYICITLHMTNGY